MPEFLKLFPPRPAVSDYLAAIPEQHPGSELVETAAAEGRILAENFHAPHPLPPFTRSSVDGYAVRAADTFGASSTLPAYLVVAGEILMGTEADLDLQEGKAALVHTGGMIPAGANAVVMLEDTSRLAKAKLRSSNQQPRVKTSSGRVKMSVAVSSSFSGHTSAGPGKLAG